MKSEDLITIVVPIYNVEKYLERCVDSIISQSYKNIEIILVDDGSKDNSSKICDEYKKRDSRIKVIHKENGGLSDARNKGIDISNGKYICFIDSDDWINKDMIETMHETIKKDNSQISICRRYRAYEDGKKIEEQYKKYPKKNIFNNIEGLSYLMSFCGYDMSACDKMFELKLFDNIRFPFGKTCEDSFTTYKLLFNAKKISYINKPFYNYFYRINSITRNSNVNETVIEAAKEQYQFVNDNVPELINEASSFLITAYISVFNEYIKRKKKCPNEKKYIKECRKLIKPSLKNKNISIIKKVQIISFCLSGFIYKFLYAFVIKEK